MTRKELFLQALSGQKTSSPVWAEMYIDEGVKSAFAPEIPDGRMFEEFAGMSACSLAWPYYPPGFIKAVDGGTHIPLLQERGDLAKMVFPDADDEPFYEPAKAFIASAPKDLAVGVCTDLSAGAALVSMGVEGLAYGLVEDLSRRPLSHAQTGDADQRPRSGYRCELVISLLDRSLWWKTRPREALYWFPPPIGGLKTPGRRAYCAL